MTPISRQMALRICEHQAVLVEFNNQGMRSSQPFTPGSQFYMSTGPYDFHSARYFLVNGSGDNGYGIPSVPKVNKRIEPGSEDAELWEEDSQPREPIEEDDTLTVRIMAENGKDPAPTGILEGAPIKLKAVPSNGSGKYSWKSSSKALKLESAGEQVLTVSVVPGQRETASGEIAELIFTPTGKSALSPVKHTLSIVKVLFQKNEKHPWGYDEAGEISSIDHNENSIQFKSDEKADRIGIEANQIGLIDVHYQGIAGAKLFFTAKDPSTCTFKIKDANQNPIVLEIHAKKVNFKETRIEARIGSLSGPIAAEIDLTIMKKVTFEAEYFRVVDPGSAGTKLKTALTTAKLQEEMNRLYKPGAVEWKIHGAGKEISSKYDIIKNGSLDLEPGEDSEEYKQLVADCKSDHVPVIHVHDLRWSYFLAADAGKKDKKIKIKDYGGYLDFIGTNNYVLEDSAGNSVMIKIKSVDVAKAEFELEAPLGVDLKVADKAALIWPLGGLSGNPTLVSDVGGVNDLVIYIAHELGHTKAEFKDIVEIENIMFGGPSTGEGMRGRAIPMYYYPDKKEKQWSTIPGRK